MSRIDFENLLKHLGVSERERRPALTEEVRAKMVTMGVDPQLIDKADSNPTFAEVCSDFLALMQDGDFAEAFNSCRRRLAHCLSRTAAGEKEADNVRRFLEKAFCASEA